MLMIRLKLCKLIVTELLLFVFIASLYYLFLFKGSFGLKFRFLHLQNRYIQPLHLNSIAKYLLYPKRQRLLNLVKIQLPVGEGGSFGP